MKRWIALGVGLALLASACTSSSEPPDEVSEIQTTTTLSPAERSAAVDDALRALIAIRRPPTDLGLFRTSLVRRVQGLDIVEYGPYVDGPPMVVESPELGLGREAVRSVLEEAAEATRPRDAAAIERALEIFDRFETDDELAARVPNPSLQAVVAYGSAFVQPSGVLRGEDGSLGAAAYAFPTADVLDGLGPDEAGEAANTFRPIGLVGSGWHGFYRTDDFTVVTVDPSRRFADPRAHIAALSGRFLGCSVFNLECSTVWDVFENRRYIDFVLADPALAQSGDRSIADLNTQAVVMLNSAAPEADGPSVEPANPLGLFPEAPELSSTKAADVCVERSWGSTCWEDLYLAEVMWWSRVAASAVYSQPGDAGPTRFALEPITESLSPVPSSVGVGDRASIDAMLDGLVSLEENVAFRVIVGLLSIGEVRAASLAAGLGERELEAHVAEAAQVAPLATLFSPVGERTTDRRYDEQAVGQVEALYNTTYVIRADGYRIELARFERADLLPGDRVENADVGFGEIEHSNGSITRTQDSQTVVSVPTSTAVDSGVELDVESGLVWHRVAAGSDLSSISAGGVEAQSDDGAFSFSCSAEGRCELAVVAGEVAVALPSGEQVEVGARELFVVDADGTFMVRTLSDAEILNSEWLWFNVTQDESRGFVSIELDGEPGPARWQGDLQLVESVGFGGEIADTGVAIEVASSCTDGSVICTATMTLNGAEADRFTGGFDSAVLEFDFVSESDDSGCVWDGVNVYSVDFGEGSATGTLISTARPRAQVVGFNCLDGDAEYSIELTRNDG